MANVVAVNLGARSGSHTEYIAGESLGRNEGLKRPLFNKTENEFGFINAKNYLLDGKTEKPGDFISLVISHKEEDYKRLGTTEEERQEALRAEIGEGLEMLWEKLGVKDVRWVAGIHRNTNSPHVHILFHKDAISLETGEPMDVPKIPHSWMWRENKNNSVVGELFSQAYSKRTVATPPQSVSTKLGNPDIEFPAREYDANRIEKTLSNFSQIQNISPDILESLQDNNSLYISRQGALTFVRRNHLGEATGFVYENGYKPEETDGFFYIGDPNKATNFIIVETPKEALALYQFTAHRDLSEVVIIASDKKNAPEALKEFLKNETNDRAIRVLWSLGLDADDVQHDGDFEQLQTEILERRAEDAAIDFISWSPRAGFGRNWSNQLRLTDTPGTLRGIVQKIYSSTRDVEELSTAETENYYKKVSDTFRKLNVERSLDEFTVNDKFDQENPKEYGKFRIVLGSDEVQRFEVYEINSKPLTEPITAGEELSAISIVESLFEGSVRDENKLISDQQLTADVERTAQDEFLEADSGETAESETAADKFDDAATVIDEKPKLSPLQAYKKETLRLKELPLEDVMPVLGLKLEYNRGEYVYMDAAGKHRIKIMDSQIFSDREQGMKGGKNAINLVTWVNGEERNSKLTFKKSRGFLADHFGKDYAPVETVDKAITRREAKRSDLPFIMPEINAGKQHLVFDYLTETRKLDPRIVRQQMNSGLIFANDYANAVFVSRTKENIVKGASWRSIYNTKRREVTGSDKLTSYFHLGNLENASTIIAVEAPIDALSYFQLYEDSLDLEKTAIVSLGGASVPDHLIEMLQTGHGENGTLIVAFDNVDSGEKGFIRSLEKTDKYVKFENFNKYQNGFANYIEFEGEIIRHTPTLEDWNEEVKFLAAETADKVESNQVADEIKSTSRPDLPPEEFTENILEIESIEITSVVKDGTIYSIDSDAGEDELYIFPISINSINDLEDFVAESLAADDIDSFAYEIILSDGNLYELSHDLTTDNGLNFTFFNSIEKTVETLDDGENSAIAKRSYAELSESIKPIYEREKKEINAEADNFIAGDVEADEPVFYPAADIKRINISVPLQLKEFGQAEILLATDANDENLNRIGYRIIAGKNEYTSFPSDQSLTAPRGKASISEAHSMILGKTTEIWEKAGKPQIKSSVIFDEPTEENFIAYLLDKVETRARDFSDRQLKSSYSILPELSGEEIKVLRLWNEQSDKTKIYEPKDIFPRNSNIGGARQNIILSLASRGIIDSVYEKGLVKIKGGMPIKDEVYPLLSPNDLLAVFTKTEVARLNELSSRIEEIEIELEGNITDIRREELSLLVEINRDEHEKLASQIETLKSENAKKALANAEIGEVFADADKEETARVITLGENPAEDFDLLAANPLKGIYDTKAHQINVAFQEAYKDEISNFDGLSFGYRDRTVTLLNSDYDSEIDVNFKITGSNGKGKTQNYILGNLIHEKILTKDTFIKIVEASRLRGSVNRELEAGNLHLNYETKLITDQSGEISIKINSKYDKETFYTFSQNLPNPDVTVKTYGTAGTDAAVDSGLSAENTYANFSAAVGNLARNESKIEKYTENEKRNIHLIQSDDISKAIEEISENYVRTPDLSILIPELQEEMTRNRPNGLTPMELLGSSNGGTVAVGRSIKYPDEMGILSGSGSIFSGIYQTEVIKNYYREILTNAENNTVLSEIENFSGKLFRTADTNNIAEDLAELLSGEKAGEFAPLNLIGASLDKNIAIARSTIDPSKVAVLVNGEFLNVYHSIEEVENIRDNFVSATKYLESIASAELAAEQTQNVPSPERKENSEIAPSSPSDVETPEDVINERERFFALPDDEQDLQRGHYEIEPDADIEEYFQNKFKNATAQAEKAAGIAGDIKKVFDNLEAEIPALFVDDEPSSAPIEIPAQIADEPSEPEVLRPEKLNAERFYTQEQVDLLVKRDDFFKFEEVSVGIYREIEDVPQNTNKIDIDFDSKKASIPEMEETLARSFEVALLENRTLTEVNVRASDEEKGAYDVFFNATVKNIYGKKVPQYRVYPPSADFPKWTVLKNNYDGVDNLNISDFEFHDDAQKTFRKFLDYAGVKFKTEQDFEDNDFTRITPTVFEPREQVGRIEKRIAKLLSAHDLNEQIAGDNPDGFEAVFSKPGLPDLHISRDAGGGVIRVAQFYEQNGELMHDGEMDFVLKNGKLNLVNTAEALYGVPKFNYNRTYANSFSTALIDQGWENADIVSINGESLSETKENAEEIKNVFEKSSSDLMNPDARAIYANFKGNRAIDLTGKISLIELDEKDQVAGIRLQNEAGVTYRTYIRAADNAPASEIYEQISKGEIKKGDRIRITGYANFGQEEKVLSAIEKQNETNEPVKQAGFKVPLYAESISYNLTSEIEDDSVNLEIAEIDAADDLSAKGELAAALANADFANYEIEDAPEFAAEYELDEAFSVEAQSSMDRYVFGIFTDDGETEWFAYRQQFVGDDLIGDVWDVIDDEIVTDELAKLVESKLANDFNSREDVAVSDYDESRDETIDLTKTAISEAEPVIEPQTPGTRVIAAVEAAQLPGNDVSDTNNADQIKSLDIQEYVYGKDMTDYFAEKGFHPQWDVSVDREEKRVEFTSKEESKDFQPKFAVQLGGDKFALLKLVQPKNESPRFVEVLKTNDSGKIQSSLYAQLLENQNLSANRIKPELKNFALESEPNGVVRGTIALADEVRNMLHDGESIKNNIQFNKMAEKAFGGTRAAGTFSPKDAYDALELGLNQYLLDHGKAFYESHQAGELYTGSGDPAMRELRELIARLPRQTDRTEEQDLFQQFSTPPTEGYAAYSAAGVVKGDVVFDPSAGVGGLSVWSRMNGNLSLVNEISTRRAGLLRILGYANVTEVDAQFLNDLLPAEVKPTVIIMNPPFSSTGGRTSKNNTFNGAEHITDALLRLEDGGRLVAVTGEGMAIGKDKFGGWWSRVMEDYNLRANVGVPGEEYGKFGTTFGNQILVIDKTGPTPGDDIKEKLSNIVFGDFKNLDDVLHVLKPLGDERREEVQIFKTQELENTFNIEIEKVPNQDFGAVAEDSRPELFAIDVIQSPTRENGLFVVRDVLTNEEISLSFDEFEDYLNENVLEPLQLDAESNSENLYIGIKNRLPLPSQTIDQLDAIYPFATEESRTRKLEVSQLFNLEKISGESLSVVSNRIMEYAESGYPESKIHDGFYKLHLAREENFRDRENDNEKILFVEPIKINAANEFDKKLIESMKAAGIDRLGLDAATGMLVYAEEFTSEDNLGDDTVFFYETVPADNLKELAFSINKEIYPNTLTNETVIESVITKTEAVNSGIEVRASELLNEDHLNRIQEFGYEITEGVIGESESFALGYVTGDFILFEKLRENNLRIKPTQKTYDKAYSDAVGAIAGALPERLNKKGYRIIYGKNSPEIQSELGGMITGRAADKLIEKGLTIEPISFNKVTKQEFISRDDLKNNPERIYLFGDNLKGEGFGGQAKEMRGEKNAVGIPTKLAPSNHESAFFTDNDLLDNKLAINEAIGKLGRFAPDTVIIIPADGLGTGLAKLEEKAPLTFAYLEEKLAGLQSTATAQATERDKLLNIFDSAMSSAGLEAGTDYVARLREEKDGELLRAEIQPLDNSESYGTVSGYFSAYPGETNAEAVERFSFRFDNEDGEADIISGRNLGELADEIGEIIVEKNNKTLFSSIFVKADEKWSAARLDLPSKDDFNVIGYNEDRTIVVYTRPNSKFNIANLKPDGIYAHQNFEDNWKDVMENFVYFQGEFDKEGANAAAFKQKFGEIIKIARGVSLSIMKNANKMTNSPLTEKVIEDITVLELELQLLETELGPEYAAEAREDIKAMDGLVFGDDNIYQSGIDTEYAEDFENVLQAANINNIKPKTEKFKEFDYNGVPVIVETADENHRLVFVGNKYGIDENNSIMWTAYLEMKDENGEFAADYRRYDKTSDSREELFKTLLSDTIYISDEDFAPPLIDRTAAANDLKNDFGNDDGGGNLPSGNSSISGGKMPEEAAYTQGSLFDQPAVLPENAADKSETNREITQDSREINRAGQRIVKLRESLENGIPNPDTRLSETKELYELIDRISKGLTNFEKIHGIENGRILRTDVAENYLLAFVEESGEHRMLPLKRKSADSAENVKAKETSAGQLDIEIKANSKKGKEIAGLGVVNYVPAKLNIGREHPAKIVESKSMAAVEPPDITYKPHLAQSLIDNGNLSNLQLEAIMYAGQRHNLRLPNGSRAGILIGDGTGVGKGRELAGIAIDNWNQGSRRVLWCSINFDLVPSTERDLSDLEAGNIPLSSLNKHKLGTNLNETFGDGVLFTSYATLIGKGKDGTARMDQITEWLGEDGVIFFDEGHLAKNAVTTGYSKASQRGEAVIELQEGEKSNPNWKIVYSSATGATELQNMAYMTRLGLWGEGTSFPGGFSEFHTTLDKGGVGSLEMAARDMKAAGMYMSRSLSYEGVDYEEVHHELSDGQKEVYNLSSKAWADVARNFDKALEITGANGKMKGLAMGRLWSSQQLFYRQLMTAMKIPSLINEIENTLEVGSVYTDPETGAKTEVPAQIVIGVIGTGEARTKDQVGKALKHNLTLDDLDFSPKQILMSVVEKAFPTKRFIEIDDPMNPGKVKLVPLKDKDGRNVESLEATRMRDALLQELQEKITLPDNPLDQIVNYFGVGNVAEITGRDKRIIIDPETGRRQYIKRARSGVAMDKASQDEMIAFQSGRKRIAIISQSASTGISLHSEIKPLLANYVHQNKLTKTSSDEILDIWNAEKNPHKVIKALNEKSINNFGRDKPEVFRRVHITLETSWSADVQMQTFGRTHRSNALFPPEYRLMSTNLGGEKRFLSTIAKRLGSLGAITKGDRDQAGGGNLLQYDFENKYGLEAAKKIINQLDRGKAELMTKLPLDPDTNEERSGLALLYRMGIATRDSGGGYAVADDVYDNMQVSRFLNRVLMLDVDTQNIVFDSFVGEMENIIQHDKSMGLFDEGVQDIKGENIRLTKDPKVVSTDRITGADTIYYRISADVPTKPVTLDMIARRNEKINIGGKLMDSNPNPGSFYQQTNSKNIIFAEYATHRTDEKTGDSVRYYSFARPHEEQKSLLSEHELTEKYQPVRLSEVKEFGKNENGDPVRMKVSDWWNAEVKNTPKIKTSESHVIAGAVLPVWQRLASSNEKGDQQSLRTVRIETEEGQRIVGVEIPPSRINRVLRDLGVDKSFKSAEEIYDAVIESGETINLIGGARLARGFIKGNPAIFVNNINVYQQNEFGNLGALKEKINWQPQVFVPGEKVSGVEILERIIERYPAVDVSGEEETGKTNKEANLPKPPDEFMEQSGFGLRRMNSDPDFAEKAASLKNKPISEYFYQVKAEEIGDGHVLVNAAGFELMRRAYEMRFGEDVTSFEGVFKDKTQADEFIKTLSYIEKKATLYKDVIEHLSDTLKSARDTRHRLGITRGIEDQGVLIILTNEDAAPHEEAHALSHIASLGKSLRDRHAHFEQLTQSPEYLKAKPELAKVNGTEQDDFLIEELWAEVSTGRGAKFNLSEDEAGTFGVNWMLSFAEKNGNFSIREFKEISNESERIRNEAYRIIYERNAETERKLDAGVELDQSGNSGKQSRGNLRSVSERLAQREADRIAAEKLGETFTEDYKTELSAHYVELKTVVTEIKIAETAGNSQLLSDDDKFAKYYALEADVQLVVNKYLGADADAHGWQAEIKENTSAVELFNDQVPERIIRLRLDKNNDLITHVIEVDTLTKMESVVGNYTDLNSAVSAAEDSSPADSKETATQREKDQSNESFYNERQTNNRRLLEESYRTGVPIKAKSLYRVSENPAQPFGDQTFTKFKRILERNNMAHLFNEKDVEVSFKNAHDNDKSYRLEIGKGEVKFVELENSAGADGEPAVTKGVKFRFDQNTNTFNLTDGLTVNNTANGKFRNRGTDFGEKVINYFEADHADQKLIAVKIKTKDEKLRGTVIKQNRENADTIMRVQKGREYAEKLEVLDAIYQKDKFRDDLTKEKFTVSFGEKGAEVTREISWDSLKQEIDAISASKYDDRKEIGVISAVARKQQISEKAAEKVVKAQTLKEAEKLINPWKEKLREKITEKNRLAAVAVVEAKAKFLAETEKTKSVIENVRPGTDQTAIRPMMTSEKIWDHQIKAVARGDAEVFERLEDLNAEKGKPRPNAIVNRLKGLQKFEEAKLIAARENLIDQMMDSSKNDGKKFKVKFTEQDGEMVVTDWKPAENARISPRTAEVLLGNLTEFAEQGDVEYEPGKKFSIQKFTREDQWAIHFKQIDDNAGKAAAKTVNTIDTGSLLVKKDEFGKFLYTELTPMNTSAGNKRIANDITEESGFEKLSELYFSIEDKNSTEDKSDEKNSDNSLPKKLSDYVQDAADELALKAAEKDQLLTEAKYHREMSLKEPINTISHFWNPLSPIGGNIAKITKPLQSVSYKVNIVKAMSGDPYIQVINAVRQFATHQIKAYQATRDAKNLTAEVSKIKNGLPEKFSGINTPVIDALDAALEKESEIREQVKTQPDTNEQFLTDTKPVFENGEVEQIVEVSRASGDHQTLSEALSEAENLTADQRYAMQAKTLIEKAKAVWKARNTITGSETLSDGSIEIEINARGFSKTVDSIQTAEVLEATSEIGMETSFAANFDLEQIEEVNTYLDLQKLYAEADEMTNLEQIIKSREVEIGNDLIKSLDLQTASPQEINFMEQQQENFYQMLNKQEIEMQMSERYKILSADAEAATKNGIPMDGIGQTFTVENTAETSLENKGEFWANEREALDRELREEMGMPPADDLKQKAEIGLEAEAVEAEAKIKTLAKGKEAQIAVEEMLEL